MENTVSAKALAKHRLLRQLLESPTYVAFSSCIVVLSVLFILDPHTSESLTPLSPREVVLSNITLYFCEWVAKLVAYGPNYMFTNGWEIIHLLFTADMGIDLLINALFEDHFENYNAFVAVGLYIHLYSG